MPPPGPKGRGGQRAATKAPTPRPAPPRAQLIGRAAPDAPPLPARRAPARPAHWLRGRPRPAPSARCCPGLIGRLAPPTAVQAWGGVRGPRDLVKVTSGPERIGGAVAEGGEASCGFTVSPRKSPGRSAGGASGRGSQGPRMQPCDTRGLSPPSLRRPERRTRAHPETPLGPAFRVRSPHARPVSVGRLPIPEDPAPLRPRDAWSHRPCRPVCLGVSASAQGLRDVGGPRGAGAGVLPI